jgi:hypothetical protein
MPTTYTIISSNVLGSATSSVTFSSIPGTYTDLVLRINARSDADTFFRQLNYIFNSSSGTNAYWRTINATGSSVTSTSASNTGGAELADLKGVADADVSYGSFEIYIPNYTSTVAKQISSFSVNERNSTTNNKIQCYAILDQVTSAVTSITLTPSANNFSTGSSFYLYGIKNS